MTIAKLVLEDGTVFLGESFGAEGETLGEVVFNTSMTGYQEILTDPSYKGQIVSMTSPHIGNYGINEEDYESRHPWLSGFIVRECSPVVSNQRASGNLDGFLKKYGVVGIQGIDTRALTRKLRISGSMNGILSTSEMDDSLLQEKIRSAPKMEGQDLVQAVTLEKPSHWKEFVSHDLDPNLSPDRFKVALIDCGVKYNIVRALVYEGCDVTVFPATTEAEVLREYDGVCFSNGPGDPAAVTYGVDLARKLISEEKPLFGICLGHQILGIALGARTYKLKFGHHGGNHPVKDLETGKIEVTSQNHGFSLEEGSVKSAGGEITHINLNDETVEGFRHTSLPLFTVQYHPEAAPGPRDAAPLFDRFLSSMEGKK